MRPSIFIGFLCAFILAQKAAAEEVSFEITDRGSRLSQGANSTSAFHRFRTNLREKLIRHASAERAQERAKANKAQGFVCRSPETRSGFPNCISRIARCSTNPKSYSGSYVGGGAGIFGDARYCHEGTWGVDYHGILFDKRIWRSWSHGRRYQGGTGAYKTDGPKLHRHGHHSSESGH